MGPMTYDDYLRSPHWRKTRKRKLEEEGYVCQGCRKYRATQVHHLHYRRRGSERMEDLEALCAICHQEKHPDKKLRRPKVMRLAPSKPRRKRKKRPKVRCPLCRKQTRFLRRHLKAKHGGFTLEELERPRREAERKRVLGLKR